MGRHAGIGHANRYVEKIGNAVLIGACARQGRPFFQAAVDFTAGQILLRHQPCFAPASGHSKGIGKVLAHLHGVFATAYGVRHDVDAAFGLACQR